MNERQRTTVDWLWLAGQFVLMVAGNAAPLLGVYIWGWDPIVVLLIYWLETGLIGFFTALKLVLALPGYRPEPGRRVRYRQAVGEASRSFEVAQMSRWSVLPMFCFGYTLAMVFVFVFAASFLANQFDLEEILEEIMNDTRGWLLLLSLLVADHALSAYVDFFRGPRWARSDPLFHLWRPAGRFVLFYFLMFAGAFLLQLFPPSILIFLFVALKLVGELFTMPFGNAQWERTVR